MSISNAHGLYGVVIDSTVIGGIGRLFINTGTEVRGEPSSGEVWARFQSLVAQKPRAQFNTMALAAALAKSALTGASIAGMTAGLNLYAQQHAAGGTRTSGSAHRKHTIKHGLLVPRRLTCEHQGDAVLEYEAIITYDGSNQPVVLTESQALPAGLTDAERFTLGPVTIESILLAQVRRFELDFGIEVKTEGSDSDIWDTYCSIESIQPTLTLRGIDLNWWKDSGGVPLTGKAATHANTKIYLRKRAAGATFVADETAQHIKFTADGLAHIADGFSADANNKAEVSLVLPMYYDGTNNPLVVNTASAIT